MSEPAKPIQWAQRVRDGVLLCLGTGLLIFEAVIPLFGLDPNAIIVGAGLSVLGIGLYQTGKDK